jgi:hypothetical protein
VNYRPQMQVVLDMLVEELPKQQQMLARSSVVLAATTDPVERDCLIAMATCTRLGIEMMVAKIAVLRAVLTPNQTTTPTVTH